MDIINIIEFQLTEIRKLFHNDLENGTVTYNYLIAENQCKFLDVYKLRKYLTETTIENLTSLKFICLKCIDIIELWNYKLEFLPDSKVKERFSKGQIISAVLDFHAIYLLEDKIINYNTHLGKETFVEENEYQLYPITKITSICFNILNFILTSYPEIKADFKPQYYLLQYKKTKSFNFQQVLRPYSKTEFIEFENHLEKYLLRYLYIFDSLEPENKIEFKQDVLDHLKRISDKQIHSKYKTLLNDTIKMIDSNFIVLNSESHQQTDTKISDYDEIESFKFIENKFDGVEPNKVMNHFKQLVINGYITQSNLELFLKSRFINNVPVKSKIEITKSNAKGRVKKIFYNYYESYASQKYGNQEKIYQITF